MNTILLTCATLSTCGFVWYVADSKLLGIALFLVSAAIYAGARLIE